MITPVPGLGLKAYTYKGPGANALGDCTEVDDVSRADIITHSMRRFRTQVGVEISLRTRARDRQRTSAYETAYPTCNELTWQFGP